MSKELTHFEVLATTCDLSIARKKTKSVTRWLVRITDYVDAPQLMPAVRKQGEALGLPPLFFHRYVAHYNDYSQCTFQMQQSCALCPTHFCELVASDDTSLGVRSSELKTEGLFVCYKDTTAERAALCGILTFPDKDNKDFVTAFVPQAREVIAEGNTRLTDVLLSRTDMAWLVVSGQLNLIANLTKQACYHDHEALLRMRRRQLLKQLDEVNDIRVQLEAMSEGTSS